LYVFFFCPLNEEGLCTEWHFCGDLR
jgi:hypothetical protein